MARSPPGLTQRATTAEGQNGPSPLLLLGQVSPPCPSPWPQPKSCAGESPECCGRGSASPPWGSLPWKPPNSQPGTKPSASASQHHGHGGFSNPLAKEGTPESLSSVHAGRARLSRGSSIPRPLNLLYTGRGEAGAAWAEGVLGGCRGSPGRCPARGQCARAAAPGSGRSTTSSGRRRRHCTPSSSTYVEGNQPTLPLVSPFHHPWSPPILL